MKKVVGLFVMLFFFAGYGNSQVYFPFKSDDKKASILAYWYNCKSDTIIVKALKDTAYLKSTFQIYGPVLSDSFYVNAEVYLANGTKAYSKSILIEKEKKSKNYEINIVNDFFLLTIPVPQLSNNPEKIKITVSSSDVSFEKVIGCKYHKLYGNIFNFEGIPLKSFVLIRPDAFDEACGVWSDSNGYYEMDLPERVYNNFYVNDGNYKLTNLEAWAWHIIMDEDQRLDFKIGTGEVYNLNAWPNNGGGKCFFISFRPMVLFHNHLSGEKQVINNKAFDLINISPDLEIKELIVTINGKQANIISLQKYFETNDKCALPAYIIQLPRDQLSVGKQSIKVEYETSIVKNGEKVFQNSMGYFQFFGNFFGLSSFN